jgi:hypothetical protein
MAMNLHRWPPEDEFLRDDPRPQVESGSVTSTADLRPKQGDCPVAATTNYMVAIGKDIFPPLTRHRTEGDFPQEGWSAISAGQSDPQGRSGAFTLMQPANKKTYHRLRACLRRVMATA